MKLAQARPWVSSPVPQYVKNQSIDQSLGPKFRETIEITLKNFAMQTDFERLIIIMIRQISNLMFTKLRKIDN